MMLRWEKIIFTLAVFAPVFLFISVAHAASVGDQRSFFVNPKYDKYARTSLAATLKYTSNHAYFYVDNNYWSTLSAGHQGFLNNAILDLAKEFDDNIYPKEVKFWGSEPNPGVDNDPRIVILLEEMTQTSGGYFETANGYSKKEASSSNEAEMIALNVEVLVANVAYIKIFIAHEFQHLISFNHKDLLRGLFEDFWLNELRSEYSVSLTGLNDSYSSSNLKRRVDVFLAEPSDSLTEWPNKSLDYGVVNMFGQYLVDQYGPEILSETLQGPLVGIASINKFLESKNAAERFEDIFADWMVALNLNDRSVGNRYGYLHPELRNIKVGPTTRSYFYNNYSDFIGGVSVKNWQPAWSEFDIEAPADKSVKIAFFGESNQNFIVSYVVYYSNGSPEVRRVRLIDGSGTVYIANGSKKIDRIVVAATNGRQVVGFNSIDQARSLSIKLSFVEAKDIREATLKDGMLIKRPNEKEIYVIWGKYKRYLVPGIFSLYGHLNPADALEVGPEVFDSYQTSNYIKYVDDEKVYAVWPDGTKHWLNITAKQWDASSRDWGAIFTINDLERKYYITGSDITR
ncbi:MAG: hypothetical protein A3B99_04070 [Candidatus Yanofskybacteria bacterium RIFCSPHIGHO2_02_FULL_44_12b]|uniref:Peptidase M6-like domain-containing protein n=1 Tax=Candidatus Yanofskybacteria bacterium RIFCSPLOWO2_01_FULL_44_22 TaxID=1802697 RepID=A0A1F8GMV2_9BACT|nr:MAG: hypothetical protein A2659_00770 [Candidatus Yanofskybacteria bacterium RIFCSPHIGHO2_01_FULL_44_24]OGN15691.1 MAG: hypothetical protein A3B99_04070 [Candidatus Yanofskybacteria bacterium RIFCSPHIGHO2_02_FULL_44_12b]OGN26747.1 MAG: hypothetical protein A2925_04155 [Candidatus Yanofskybacteria bacterium RIFCSPLOWO2_01_FULL_44_22]